MKKLVILMLHLRHGGIEKQTITLANSLCNDYDVEIISTYSMQADPAYPISPNVSIRYLIDGKPNREEFQAAMKSKNPFRILQEGVRAMRILRQKKRRMIKAIKALQCDYVLSTRIEFAQMLSKYAPKGVVTLTQEHLHNDDPAYVNRARKAFRNLDYLVVLCPGAKENFIRWMEGNPKIKIVEIPNMLAQIPDKTANLCGHRLIAAGRLHPVKNFETLIDVFHRVVEAIPDATLTIVGGGEEYDRLQKQVETLQLQSSVTVTGMVDAGQVEQYMLESDLYVMTSHTECFPMVLLEASGVGLPLIAFDVPVGPKAIIHSGENGYLIEYPCKDAMAETIIQLLQDCDKLAAWGAASKKLAYQYLPEQIVPLWREILK